MSLVLSFYNIVPKFKHIIAGNRLSNAIIGNSKLNPNPDDMIDTALEFKNTNRNPDSISQFIHEPPKFIESRNSIIIKSEENKLFEEFFIIGEFPDVIDSIEIVSMNYLPSKVIFQYPGLNENENWYL